MVPVTYGRHTGLVSHMKVRELELAPRASLVDGEVLGRAKR